MILSVGEILTDMIGTPRGDDFYYERKAGGAPFNVACAAGKLGAQTAFVGSVGDDVIGAFLKRFAESVGFSDLLLDVKPDRNTTMAIVDVDASGERSFCFYRKHTADYVLPGIPDELIAKANIVHIGSLMLSEPEGRDYALRLIERVKNAGKKVSFDVNFRTDIFRDKAEAIAIYRKVIEKANIVKFSEDELDIFGEEYVSSLDALVCVSLGSAGSEWRYKNNARRVPTVKVKPVDTTGAGDAFFAGVLSGLDRLGKADYESSELDEIFRFANVCGALNTLGRGAIDHLPSREDVINKLREAE